MRRARCQPRRRGVSGCYAARVMKTSPLVVLALVAGGSLLVALGSCQGGGAATTGSGGHGGGAGGGSTSAGLFGDSGFGGMLADGCGGPPAVDGGDGVGHTACEGIEAGLPYKEVGAIFAGCQGESCHGSPTHDATV